MSKDRGSSPLACTKCGHSIFNHDPNRLHERCDNSQTPYACSECVTSAAYAELKIAVAKKMGVNPDDVVMAISTVREPEESEACTMTTTDCQCPACQSVRDSAGTLKVGKR